MPQGQNSSPGLPDSSSGPSPGTKWPLRDVIPKPQSVVFPPSAEETEGREGWQVSRRPPGPSGSPLPHRLRRPAFAQLLPCASWAVTSKPARMALSFTQRHFLGDSHPHTQPCTPRGLLGGSPSVREHWQQRPWPGARWLGEPHRTEGLLSGTSVGRDRRAHPQGTRHGHTCAHRWLLELRVAPPPDLAAGSSHQRFVQPSGCAWVPSEPLGAHLLGPTPGCLTGSPASALSLLPLGVGGCPPEPSLGSPTCSSPEACLPGAISGRAPVCGRPSGRPAPRTEPVPSLGPSPSPLITPPSAYLSPQAPSTSLLSVCNTHQGLLAQPRGRCILGVSLGLQDEGQTLNLSPTALPPRPSPALRCGLFPCLVSDPSRQAAPPTRRVKRGPSGDGRVRSTRGLNPGMGSASSRWGVHTLGGSGPRPGSLGSSVCKIIVSDRSDRGEMCEELGVHQAPGRWSRCR